jgi:hypothetical protein
MAAAPKGSPGTGLSKHTAANGMGSDSHTTGSASQVQHNCPGGRRGPQCQQCAPKATKFEGRCADLAGHVYDYSSSQLATDQYTKTMREICKYIS